MATTSSVQTAAHVTLTGTEVDTVNLAAYGRYIQVINRGSTDPIYVTFGAPALAATPTVAGANTFVVTATVPLIVPWPVAGGFACQVKLISAGNIPYSVQVLGDRIA